MRFRSISQHSGHGDAPKARQRNPVPTYRFHAATGKAVITYYDANGARRSVLLPGEFNSEASRREYKRVLAILKAGGEPKPSESSTQTNKPVPSVVEVIARYWLHVE